MARVDYDRLRYSPYRIAGVAAERSRCARQDVLIYSNVLEQITESTYEALRLAPPAPEVECEVRNASGEGAAQSAMIATRCAPRRPRVLIYQTAQYHTIQYSTYTQASAQSVKIQRSQTRMREVENVAAIRQAAPSGPALTSPAPGVDPHVNERRAEGREKKEERARVR